MAIAAPQQRQIKGAAVKGDAEVATVQQVGDGQQQRPLFSRLAHQELADDKMSGRVSGGRRLGLAARWLLHLWSPVSSLQSFKRAHANQKGIYTCPTAQTRGFCIEKNRLMVAVLGVEAKVGKEGGKKPRRVA